MHLQNAGARLKAGDSDFMTTRGPEADSDISPHQAVAVT